MNICVDETPGCQRGSGSGGITVIKIRSGGWVLGELLTVGLKRLKTEHQMS